MAHCYNQSLGRFITLERWKRRCSQRDERGLRQIWSQIRCLPISVGQKCHLCYGNSPEYNKFFIEQLTELLSNYGEIHEVWFDGACGEGPNGKKQEYDWDQFYKTIQKLQPNAVMAIMGDDVRWVGNEKGYGRETEWSATALVPGIYSRSDSINTVLGLKNKSEDLGSRALLEQATELFWYPSEVDVSIRPGWFYHREEDDKVKSLSTLVDIYFKSVG